LVLTSGRCGAGTDLAALGSAISHRTNVCLLAGRVVAALSAVSRGAIGAFARVNGAGLDAKTFGLAGRFGGRRASVGLASLLSRAVADGALVG
jgi:hypothetical protein